MDDPTCLFRCDAGLLQALERALGPPIDSYLNGWQVWIEPLDVPGAAEPVELEFRLHPPAGFEQPEGLSHHELWDAAIEQVVAGVEELELGEETRRLDQVWILLEVYPGFGDPMTPDELRRAVEDLLDTPALGAGRVDHGRLGSRWKRTRGGFDLPGALLEALVADEASGG